MCRCNWKGPFAIAAVLERADPLDAWVSNHYEDLHALPVGGVVGTSSLRRRARLRSLRPDLEVRDLRGNVNTRLAKLDAGEYDAIILACAGLKRLGFESRIRQRLPADMWLPAVSQGAIAVEIRAGDVRLRELLSGLDHALTRSCVEAERSMNRALEGSCQVPIAGYCEVVSSELWLRAWVGNALTASLFKPSRVDRFPRPTRWGRLWQSSFSHWARRICWRRRLKSPAYKTRSERSMDSLLISAPTR
jgi:hydroxymethylbilane synthase